MAPALISELAGNPTLEARFRDAFLLLLGSLAAGLYIVKLAVDDTVITDVVSAATAGITALAERHHSEPNGAGPP